MIGGLVRRLWRALTRRRTVTWAGILGVTAVAFVALTRELTPNAVVKPALSWLIALIAWALAVLFWDLAIVWIEYVSQRRHLDYLKEVWGISGPAEAPANAAKAEPERLWWTR